MANPTRNVPNPSPKKTTWCKPIADHVHRCHILQAAFRDENTIRRGEVPSPLFCTGKGSHKVMHYECSETKSRSLPGMVLNTLQRHMYPPAQPGQPQLGLGCNR
jgi:hypothetical protein